MAKLKNACSQTFMHNGKHVDYDWYVFTHSTPLSTQETSVYIDFLENEITGDRIAYGSWDDIERNECIELLQTLQPSEIIRNFERII